MKILVLADCMPYPLTHGQNLRIYHYVRVLSERHRFDLICFGEQYEPPESIMSIFHYIEILPDSPQQTTEAGLFASFSIQQMMPEDPRVTERIKELQRKEDYDLIWLAGERMVQNVPYGGSSATLVDLVDDVVLMRLREARTAERIIDRIRAYKRAAMNYLFERRYYGQADACMVVAEPDAEMFSRICPNVPVRTIHNGVDANYFTPWADRLERALLVFEGNMSFAPNVDGAVHFVRRVLPRIQEEVPEAHLIIVGKNPVKEVKALASSSVEVTGFVDDVRPYMSKAEIFVCPLRKGSGIKNKILQAWAMQKAVVATPQSTGGLATRVDENICIAPLMDGFSDKVIELLLDDGKRNILGVSGRETVLAHYSWQRKAEDLEGLMNEVVANHAGTC